LKIKNKGHHIFGIIGLSSFIITAYLVYWAGQSMPQQLPTFYQSLKSKVQTEIQALQQAQTQWQELAFANPDTLLFSQKLPQNYQYFLFQNQKLLFWSDFRFVPQASWLHGDYYFRLGSREGHLYLITQAQQVRNADTLRAYSLLNIYQDYKIRNAYLQSGLNKEVFLYDNLEIIQDIQKKEYQNIYSPRGEFLFAIKLKKEIPHPPAYLSVLGLISFLLGFVCTLIWIGILSQHLAKQRQYTRALLIWGAYLVLLRLGMILGSVPHLWLQSNWLDATYYQSTWLNPSLADLVLNLLFFGFWIGFLVRNIGHFWWVRFLLKLNPKYKPLLMGASILGVLLTLSSFIEVLSTLFFDSELSLDITRSLDFSYNSLNAIFVFALNTLVFFLLLHFFARLFLQFFSKKNKGIFGLVLLAVLGLYWIVSYVLGDAQSLVVISSGLFFIGLIRLDLPRYLYRFVYATFIYFFVGALIFASLGAYSIYKYGQQKSLKERRAFATLLIPEQDPLSEMLLSQAIKQVKTDNSIKSALQDTSIQKNELAQDIRKKYLSKNFDRYETEVLLFGTDNQSLDPQHPELNYQDFYNRYQRVDYGTSRPEIFFIDLSGINLVRHYVAFVEIKNPNNTAFNLIIDLKQNRDLSNNVYPELLIDQASKNIQKVKNYSYAFYDHRQLVYSIGSYNYARDFKNEYFDQESLFFNGLKADNYEHLSVEISSKKVVVSILVYSWKAILSNFAFLFLVLMFEILGFMVIYSFINRVQGFKGNFATRIQFYLNISFFLPLLTVSITTLSIISANYREDFSKSFAEDTRRVARNLSPYLDQYLQQGLNQETFTDQSLQIARNAGLDINVFDASGRLIMTSQPAIYEIGILSRYINPAALREIKYQGETQSIQKESVGGLSYVTVYMPLKSYESEQLLGLVSIPFFDFRYELEQRLIEVLSTIINIFVSILIVFLFLSYFASQILIIPLRLITQKIRKTSFYDYSDPLVWESKDEIGLFVKEYNRMLQKLDKSMEALARGQRESAWREIAQQVAHEIKNPLTPIRLTLQMMQKRLEGQSEKVRATFERSIDTLIEQADILNDIATSFSSFAKMPVPNSERFEIIELLQSAESLYAEEKIEVTLNLISGAFYVQGDRKLMGRIFTNLVKNALEATPEDREAKMEISLTVEAEGIIRLAFKDNGEGVSLEAQDKLFMPNFTTKTTGSGIGLAVSKRGIEHAGGRIWFETEIEIGTTFFIELPLVD
jgi:signal transduction histidine kinase